MKVLQQMTSTKTEGNRYLYAVKGRDYCPSGLWLPSQSHCISSFGCYKIIHPGDSGMHVNDLAMSLDESSEWTGCPELNL